MKKIISVLVLFVSGFGLAQHQVVITLQEGNFTENNTQISSFFTITDAGLNQILSNHNASYFQAIMVSCSSYNTILAFLPINENLSNFLNDLNNYDAVVLDAQVAGLFDTLVNNTLSISLVDSSVGSFQSLTNGIVQTNNLDLNAIFQIYNVFEYSNVNGQVTRCNCNVDDLKTSLQNLNTIISNVEDLYCFSSFLLKNENFENQKPTISPNPFTSTFVISNKETITNYNLYDVVGKEIVKTNSKTVLDSKTEALKSGVYLLELTFDNGKTDAIKLIKN